MFHHLIRKKRFWIGFLFLFILLTLSIANTVFNDGNIAQVMFVKNKDGMVIDAPPFSPLEVFWFGSDQWGYSVAHQMVEGAKYTILIVSVIAAVRMILSLILSYFVHNLKPSRYKMMKNLFEPFTVIPQTFISYFILASVLRMNGQEVFVHPFWQRALFEVFVLSVIAIPNLTVQLSGEMRSLQREPFFEAGKVLGGTRFHQFCKHLLPNLYDKWIIMFGHQFLQVLLVLAHLGLFELFFAGTILKDTSALGVPDPPRSLTYEWSGILGNRVGFFYAKQWLALVPFTFYALTAISIFLINDSIKSAFLQSGNRPSKQNKDMKIDMPLTSGKAFEFIQK